jgi:hypothetical protein
MKSLMREFVTVGIAASSLFFEECDARAQGLTLDHLIQHNVQAVGGEAAIESVQSIRFDLRIVGAGFEANATYYAARPGRMRIDLTAEGKRVYAEAFDGKRAWQWKGKGEQIEESETASAALRHGIELPGKLFGLHELQRRGLKLELVGRELVDQVNYHVVRLTFPDGVTTKCYFDPKSWLMILRRDVRPLHPDIDPTPTTIENRMSDFRKVGNLIFSFASTDTDLKTGEVLETTKVREIRLNPPVAIDFFDRLESPH